MRTEKQLPFSEDEFKHRINTLRRAMVARGFDAVLLFSPSNLFYFSGFWSVNLWDFACLIIPLADEPVLVIREFERGRFDASCHLVEPWTYPPEGSGSKAVVEALRRLHFNRTRLGLEMSRHLDARSYALLQESLPDSTFCNASGVVDEIRAVKSPKEIDYLRHAASITDIGMEAALSVVREGGTDSEVAAEANRALISSGSHFFCIDPIVAVGCNAGRPHSTVSGVQATRTDPVFIELGACIHRYTAPLMRTAAVGHVTREIRELADYSNRALDAVIEAMGPGASAHQVADAGQRALAPIESRIFFHYVWAYPVGVGFPPSWLEESEFFIQSKNVRELQAGMVFHLPLMLRVLGRYGAGFSETVLITQTGTEVLTKSPRKLRVA